MAITIQQPQDLIRFISNIPVLNDGTIPTNTISDGISYTSTIWTPVYAMSVLARETTSIFTDGTLELVNTPLDSSTIVYMALNSDLATTMPSVYMLLRSIVLESFAFIYSIDYAPANLKYVTATDFQNIKTNIKYIADYFSSNSKYYNMISPMRDMAISFGYVENQVDVIMNDMGVDISV